jgi:2-iminobutanoate/2-iminopropanoate deaminase
MVFTAGQVYLTKEGKLLEGTVEEQVHQIMHNLKAILEAGGADFSDVVKTTIYLTDLSLFSQVNSIYGSYFAEPYPARETIGVKDIPLGAKIEISMIAIKD